MKIIVLGAGAWGTAIAISAARRAPVNQVTLWARDAELVKALQTRRVNDRYLPDIALPEALQIVGSDLGGGALAAVAGEHDLIIIATPVSAARSLLQSLATVRVPVVWLSKGFEAAQPATAATLEPHGLLVHEILGQVAINLRAGVLSGPSFAQEVARGQPTALVAASDDPDVREALVAALHSPTLRVYASDDMVGVEVGGAVKNVLAIAAGLCDGLQLGLNARAALITRGLAEITRLGIALGARPETFTGLSGLGDLVLTATGDLSRNRKVGLALAQGKTLQQAVTSLGHVAEGVYCARTVVQRAAGLGVDMPISRGVVALLNGEVSPREAVAALMERGPTAELS